MHGAQRDLAIVIVAGGAATRFPGKLEAEVAGEPLLARVYHRLRHVAPTLIAARGTYAPRLDALLDCPLVVDRWPDRGPLGGLLTAAQQTRAKRVFVAAGDAPEVGAEIVDALCAAWQAGDEAAVPVHGERLEPLAALYDREALLREGWAVLHAERASMHALLARLNTRRVALDSRFFVNVNTPNDLHAFAETT